MTKPPWIFEIGENVTVTTWPEMDGAIGVIARAGTGERAGSYYIKFASEDAGGWFWPNEIVRCEIVSEV